MQWQHGVVSTRRDVMMTQFRKMSSCQHVIVSRRRRDKNGVVSKMAPHQHGVVPNKRRVNMPFGREEFGVNTPTRQDGVVSIRDRANTYVFKTMAWQHDALPI